MATWTAALYLKELRDNLQLRPGLDGVQIHGAPIGSNDRINEAIAFIDIDTVENSAALGDRRREEEYVIEGVIEVNQAGSGDDIADVARERAIEILAEIEAEVRAKPDAGLNTPGVEQIVRMSEITRKNLRQRTREDYRVAIIEVDVTVRTRI